VIDSPTPAPATDPQPGMQRLPSLPVCWPALTEAEAKEAHDTLADWITWLTDRYTLDHRTVPPCWHHHGALVEELSALHTAWRASYNLTARPEALLQWHEHFSLARQRLTDWVARTGCRPGEHRAST
jgi:hypothetical protein